MTLSTRSLRYQEITTVEPHVTFSYTDDKWNFAEMSLLNLTCLSYRGVDISVDKVTNYGLDNRRNMFRFPAREPFLFPKAFRQL